MFGAREVDNSEFPSAFYRLYLIYCRVNWRGCDWSVKLWPLICIYWVDSGAQRFRNIRYFGHIWTGYLLILIKIILPIHCLREHFPINSSRICARKWRGVSPSRSTVGHYLDCSEQLGKHNVRWFESRKFICNICTISHWKFNEWRINIASDSMYFQWGKNVARNFFLQMVSTRIMHSDR